MTDVLAARAWLIEVFDFSPTLIEESEDAVTGAVVEHPSGLMIGLHQDADRCAALSRFVVLALATADLPAWATVLDERRVAHSAVESDSLGQRLQVQGPGGLAVEIHSLQQPDLDEA